MAAKWDQIRLPEGLVTFPNLFEKDAYTPQGGQPGKPQYKNEMVYEWDDIEDVIDELLDIADKEWPDILDDYDDIDAAYDDDALILPFIDGTKYAKKRRRDKPEGKFDHYEDMALVRPHTEFNLHGANAPGGIQVLNAKIKPIDPMQASEIYPGCYGFMLVTPNCYMTNDGDWGISFYLNAFQKSRDGERLFAQTDYSGAFDKLDTEEKGERRGRRRRR